MFHSLFLQFFRVVFIHCLVDLLSTSCTIPYSECVEEGIESRPFAYKSADIEFTKVEHVHELLR